MKAEEIRAMTTEELGRKLDDLKEELFNLLPVGYERRQPYEYGTCAEISPGKDDFARTRLGIAANHPMKRGVWIDMVGEICAKTRMRDGCI